LQLVGRSSTAVGSRWTAVFILVLLGFFGWRWTVGSRSGDLPPQPRVGPASDANGAGEEQRLRDAVAQRPADPGPHLALARHAMRQGRIAEAAWEYQDVAGTHPDAAAVQGELAAALGRLRLHGVAIRLLEEQMRRGSPAAEHRCELAELYLSTGSPERAAAVLTTSVDGGRAAPEAGLTLGRAYLALGRVAAARDAFRQYVRGAPGDPEGEFWLGRVAWVSGQATVARHFLQAIEITPTDPEPHRHLADTLAALGERAEAARRRGLYYSLSDQPARAILEYERLQAIDPGGIDAPLLISQSCVQMRQNERAVAVLEQALKRHPRNPVLSERLATLYVLLHSPKEAEATCREWLRGDPEAARARWVLGRAAYADHRIEEAARQYEEALTRAPGEAEFCFALGGALEQLAGADRRPRALALLGRAVELKPDVPEYRYRLGVAYQQRGEWEPARRELLATLDLDPSHAGAYNALTQVAQGVRQPHQVRLWAEAMRAVQERQREETSDRLEAGARPRDPAVWFALAQTLLRAGELEKAQGQLEQSLWLRPGWPEARRALARVAALRAVM